MNIRRDVSRRRSGLGRWGGAVVLAGLTILAVAPSAGAAAADPDTDYVVTNAQTNLAEIALAGIVLDRSDNAEARDLATTTRDDHQAALDKLTGVADSMNITLPAAPSAQQQADAATLQAASDADFDLTYAQLQVAGHQKSVDGTKSEIATGQQAAVVEYANGYLPVASHHLEMATMLLSDLGGSPSAVPAGTGGLLPSAGGSNAVGWSLMAGGALLFGAGAVWLVRRRAAV